MPESSSSAAERGFTMPAEWEEQCAILLSWPLNPVTWEDRRAALETTYAGFAAAISRFEDVIINCVAAEQPRVLKLLNEAGADLRRGMRLHDARGVGDPVRDIAVVAAESRNVGGPQS